MRVSLTINHLNLFQFLDYDSMSSSYCYERNPTEHVNTEKKETDYDGPSAICPCLFVFSLVPPLTVLSRISNLLFPIRYVAKKPHRAAERTHNTELQVSTPNKQRFPISTDSNGKPSLERQHVIPEISRPSGSTRKRTKG